MKPGRNALCPCGSGKKYKRCCLVEDEAAASTRSLSAQARVVERDGQQFLVSDGVSERDLSIASEHFAGKDHGRGPGQDVAAFTQPLIDASDGSAEAVERAMALGMLFWNIALIGDEDEREDALASAGEDLIPTPGERGTFESLGRAMIARHSKLFPHLHRR